MEYKFVGDGAGVAGLPHVVTEEEARELGVWELLQDAVRVGLYATPLPAASPQIEESNLEGEKQPKKKEVKHGR